MAAEIESKRPDAAIEFIGEQDAPGTFNVVADGVELWNKHERGGFPKQAEIIEIIEVIEKLPPTPRRAELVAPRPARTTRSQGAW